METVNAGNLAKGMFVIFKGAPHMVTKAEFMAPGKGSPIMRVKLRNVKTAVVQEFTYKTNESVEVADVDKREMVFLYKDGDSLVFMDPKNYEQAEVPVALVEEQVGCFIADMKCYVLWHDGEAMGVDLPPNVALRVVESPDVVAGNRINAPKKLVKLETGLEVQAPLFIKEGEMILIDTATMSYVSRLTNQSV
jgi:elongation factor P